MVKIGGLTAEDQAEADKRQAEFDAVFAKGPGGSELRAPKRCDIVEYFGHDGMLRPAVVTNVELGVQIGRMPTVDLVVLSTKPGDPVATVQYAVKFGLDVGEWRPAW